LSLGAHSDHRFTQIKNEVTILKLPRLKCIRLGSVRSSHLLKMHHASLKCIRLVYVRWSFPELAMACEEIQKLGKGAVHKIRHAPRRGGVGQVWRCVTWEGGVVKANVTSLLKSYFEIWISHTIFVLWSFFLILKLSLRVHAYYPHNFRHASLRVISALIALIS